MNVLRMKKEKRRIVKYVTLRYVSSLFLNYVYSNTLKFMCKDTEMT